VSACHRLETLKEGAGEFLDRIAGAHHSGGKSRDRGEDVFHAMLQFVQQPLLAAFRVLVPRYVDQSCDGATDLA
jgi:hypothetical protein